MKNFVEVGQELQAGMAKLGEEEPSAMQAFGALMGATVGTDGALSVKVKELIALAIAISVRCDGCIAHHVRAVIEAGATREELIEVIGVTQLMGGGPATVYGIEAMQAWDQFQNA
ncbi:carboxymuconolactone decarboxylase family protein [uncultured Parvibaculum sp.]|uniref:carboxymuconolactone decarboxylase family protein n=1 Tax=uncultured Parvibaculum sp. TaxID=291828 RepID=UPI0030DCAE8F